MCIRDRVYFVERDILKIHEDFRQAMCQLSRAIKARNDLQQQYYENVCPQWIAASQYSLRPYYHHSIFIIRFIVVGYISLYLCFYSFMCTILFIFVYYSILFTSCSYFVYCIFVYFVYSSIQPLAVILQ